MINRTESALRDALTQLADAAPPPGLAAAAIRSARRQHRVRATVVGVASVAAVVLATPVAFSAISPETGRPPEDPTMGPLVVTAIIDGSSSLLLDRATGDYVVLPYLHVTPSPDGTRELVGGRPGFGPQFGIRDARTGTVRWIEDYADTGSENVRPGAWSRDGREILITAPVAYSPSGFAIVDADTLEVTVIEQDDINAVEGGAQYAWTPGGDEIVLTQPVQGTNQDEEPVSGIRFYDRDGNLTRTVEATAALPGEAGFSPNGSRMALQDLPGNLAIQVVDADTGEVYHTLQSPDADLVGWADEDHLIVSNFVRQSLQVINLTGQVIQEVSWPNHGVELHIGSSDGLNPDAAELTFGVR